MADDVLDVLADWPGWATLLPKYGDVTSGQGNGETLVKSLLDPRWSLHAESKLLSPNEIRKWKAKLMKLANGRRIFLGYDFAQFYPAAYPKGTWPTGGSFNGTTASIHAIGDDGASISVAGLPAGFKGTEGDGLSITYGDDDADLALVAAGDAFLANGSGVTGTFSVGPFLPIGVQVGDAVSVKRPTCHFRLVPGSVTAPDDSSARGRITFDAIQVPTL